MNRTYAAIKYIVITSPEILHPQRLQPIQRAGRATRCHLQHMGINHRRAHIAVPQQLLHGASVRARLQQMRGKAMAQGAVRALRAGTSVLRRMGFVHCLGLSSVIASKCTLVAQSSAMCVIICFI